MAVHAGVTFKKTFFKINETEKSSPLMQELFILNGVKWCVCLTSGPKSIPIPLLVLGHSFKVERKETGKHVCLKGPVVHSAVCSLLAQRKSNGT